MKKFLFFTVAAFCLSATVNAQVDTTKRDTTKKRRDSTNIQHPVSFKRSSATLRTASDLTFASYNHEAILERKSQMNMKKQEDITA